MVNSQQLIEKGKSQNIGRVPVVVLPLKDWRKIEDMLEEYQMSRSQKFIKSIQKAREEVKAGKVYEFDLKTGKFKKLAKTK